MENINLTSEEKRELEKRGFFVKDLINFMEFSYLYWLYIGIFIGLFIPLWFAGFSIGERIFGGGEFAKWLGFLGAISPLFYLFRGTFFYIFIGKFFYVHDGVYAFGRKYKPEEEIRYLKWIKWSLNFKRNRKAKFNLLDILFNPQEYGSFSGFLLLLGGAIALGIFFYISSINGILLNVVLWGLLGVYIGFFGLPTIFYLFRQLIEHFHPLYAFGNLGEKIQKLTPEIEEQSKLIQSEFQKDMNFSGLHSGFEKLSSTFSSIVELVLKLERIESKANKGNLFDSAKYIDSLRADIVTPLTELKKFLEGQRKQLLESQKELSRVRVGGDPEINSGGRENIELQSKRSESLLQELDSNIAALGEMISKMN